jgi:ABC-type bacteriocin/lantibiotic exporter with double-glycine peptidase domain
MPNNATPNALSRTTHVHSPKLPSPFRRLTQLLWEDKQDLVILLIYTGVSGVLSLMLPIASQALINIIASGVLLQPLIVLTVVVVMGLLFAGIIRVVELTLMEVLQQRLYVRITLHLGSHLPRIDMSQLLQSYPPELVNRFFETVTIQKALAKVLLNFPAAIVQVFISMIFMGFYSPYFLIFNVLVLLSYGMFILLGRGGVKTSLVQSKYKYAMAHFLEDVARCQLAFKINSGLNFSILKTDGLSTDYVKARRKHFHVVIRQTIWHVTVNAFVTAGLLAVGGWLVMHGKLTLGQLVAAELMTLLMLNATTKIVENLETWYDLLTGLDKLGFLTDLPAETYQGVEYIVQKKGMALSLNNLGYTYPNQPGDVFRSLQVELKSGGRVALVGPSGAGKTTLTELLLGLLRPNTGAIQVNRQQLQDINLEEFRRYAALVESPNSIFAGTVRDNITMGRAWVDDAALEKALQLVAFDDVVRHMPSGLDMLLESEGVNLSAGKRQMLLLARAVAGDPELLVLDEAFHNIDRPTRLEILRRVFSAGNPWTILTVTHDTDVLSFCDYVYMLNEGQIAGSGSPHQLVRERNTLFWSLFPNFETTGRGE